jgi:hypothetical protein
MPSGMRERRCGRIIAMPSMADPLEPAGKVAYVASGAGLHERMRTTSMPSNEINAIWILLDTLAAPPAPPFVRGRLRAHPGGSNQRTRRPPRRGGRRSCLVAVDNSGSVFAQELGIGRLSVESALDRFCQERAR